MVLLRALIALACVNTNSGRNAFTCMLMSRLVLPFNACPRHFTCVSRCTGIRSLQNYGAQMLTPDSLARFRLHGMQRVSACSKPHIGGIDNVCSMAHKKRKELCRNNDGRPSLVTWVNGQLVALPYVQTELHRQGPGAQLNKGFSNPIYQAVTSF